jgi:hypothetical protein
VYLITKNPTVNDSAKLTIKKGKKAKNLPIINFKLKVLSEKFVCCASVFVVFFSIFIFL